MSEKMDGYVLVPRERFQQFLEEGLIEGDVSPADARFIASTATAHFFAARPSHCDDLLKAMEEVCEKAANVRNGVYFYEHGNREKELADAFSRLHTARQKAKP